MLFERPTIFLILILPLMRIIRVVAYDANGYPKMEKTVKTAGKPHHIELSTYRSSLTADGKDLAYVTARIVDKDGNLCPLDGRLMTFSVEGAGVYRASSLIGENNIVKQ